MLLAGITLPTMAQREIKGTVLDDNGEPLIGASVKISTGGGTAADLDGNFKLTVENDAKSLTVSYVGYKSKTVKLQESRSFYKIVLQLETTTIKDVVVIGYGAVKKGDVTASVSKVDAEDIEDRPVTNTASLLQGELAGVEIRNTSGAPGGEVNVNVRGSVTLNDPETSGDFTDNTNPLYVVDGVPMDEDFDLSMLNVSDIASIEVLKDASSSAIYGSRGANGVIIVTSKRPDKNTGRFSINASANFSLQQVNKKLDVMSGDQWASWMSKITDQRWIDNYSKQGATTEDGAIIRSLMNGHAEYRDYTSYRGDPRWKIAGHPGLSYIDWQEQMLRIAPQQQYNVSAMGQTKESSYRVSVGYANQQGIIRGTDYKRLSATLQGQTTVGMVTFGVSAAPSLAVSNGASTSGGSSSDKTNLGILRQVPIAESAAGLETGAYPYDNYAWASKTSTNSYVKLDRISREKQTFLLRSSAFVRVKPMKGLVAELLGSWNMRHEARRNFVPSNTVSAYSYTGEGAQSTGEWWDKKSHNFSLQATVNYEHKFGKHGLNGMLGWSVSQSKYADDVHSYAENFINDQLIGYTLTSADVYKLSNTITTSTRMVSYFARAIYNYDERYLLNVSLRRDGSSKFGDNTRWATFPAFSAAWRISNESFWPEDFVINSAKVRMSYGLNGRNNIRMDAIKTTMTNVVTYFGDNRVRGYALNKLGNPDLGWQKVDSWDFAIDMGLWKNRLSFSIDYYYKRTRNLLYQLQLPAISGYDQAYFNIGSIENHGLDIELKSINILKPFKWTTSLNLGFQGSKVIDLGGNDHIECGYNARGNGGKTQILEVGRAVGDYYLYDAIGVFQSQEELNSYPHITSATVGSLKLRDVNGDGVINSDDRIYCGNPRPDVTFGLTNRFNYKNWELSILITGQFGGKIFAASGFTGNLDSPRGQTPNNNMLDKWENMYFSESDPGDGSTPCVWNAVGYGNTTRNLYSSDYVRLKNMMLSYKFPMNKKAFVKGLTVMLSVENLAQWDRYDAGYSPEGAVRMSSTSCYDEVAYPLARTYSLGVKVNM